LNPGGHCCSASSLSKSLLYIRPARSAGSGRCGAPHHWPAILRQRRLASAPSDGLCQTPRCQTPARDIATQATSLLHSDSGSRPAQFGLRLASRMHAVALLPAEAPRKRNHASSSTPLDRGKRCGNAACSTGTAGRAGRRKRARRACIGKIVAADGGLSQLDRVRCRIIQRESWDGERFPKQFLHLSSGRPLAQPCPPAVLRLSCPSRAGVIYWSALWQGEGDQRSEALCQRSDWRRFCFRLRMGPPTGREHFSGLIKLGCARPPVRWMARGLTERVRLTPMGRELGGRLGLVRSPSGTALASGSTRTCARSTRPRL